MDHFNKLLYLLTPGPYYLWLPDGKSKPEEKHDENK